nr:MAG TPA: hypothetical protein [Caudoviricetes sp.]DAP43371.1 MAG TPA: hypothetical protein [Caudoviricetes sp.]
MHERNIGIRLSLIVIVSFVKSISVSSNTHRPIRRNDALLSILLV